MKLLNLIILYTFCFSTKLTYGQLSWQRIGLIFGEAENDRFGYSSSISSDGKIVAIASTFNKGLTESGRGGDVVEYEIKKLTNKKMILFHKETDDLDEEIIELEKE